MTNWIAFFLFIKLISNLLPTILLHYVIYYVPRQAGKIKEYQIRGDNITITSSRTLSSSDEEIKNLKDSVADTNFLYDDDQRIKSNTLMDKKSGFRFSKSDGHKEVSNASFNTHEIKANESDFSGFIENDVKSHNQSKHKSKDKMELLCETIIFLVIKCERINIKFLNYLKLNPDIYRV